MSFLICGLCGIYMESIVIITRLPMLLPPEPAKIELVIDPKNDLFV